MTMTNAEVISELGHLGATRIAFEYYPNKRVEQRQRWRVFAIRGFTKDSEEVGYFIPDTSHHIHELRPTRHWSPKALENLEFVV